MTIFSTRLPLPFLRRGAFLSLKTKPLGKAKGDEPELKVKKAADKMPTPQQILSPRKLSPPDYPELDASRVQGETYAPSLKFGKFIDNFGLPSSLSKTFTNLNHKALLWRPSSDKLLTLLNAEGQRIVLEGPRGAGKSCLLLQLADILSSREVERDSLLIYLPRLKRWTAGYYPYRQNAHDPKLYDQPELAIEIIKQIICLNPTNPLRPVLTDYLTKAEADPSLASKGLAQCLEYVQDRPRTLLIDEINALYAPTAYFNVSNEPLGINGLSVLRTIKSFFECSGKHVKLVGAIGHDPSLQKYMIPPNALGIRQKFQLDYFSTNEVKSLLEYYKSVGHVLQGVNVAFAEKIRFVSGGAGDKILPAANYNSVYQNY